MAAGNATTGRVRCAFEDAGNCRNVKRGGDKNYNAREGELVDARRRCRKWQDVSQWRIERWRRCDEI